jgi:type I restriction enzyme S subunit
MTPEELRNSILHLAIQGKLTERLPSDGFASDLLKDCQLSDNVDGQRVKQKTITDVDDDEKTLDIPSTWEWVKLGKICIIARGGSPRPIKTFLTTEANGVNWIKIGDTNKNEKYISSTAEKIKPSGVSKSRMVYAGDFLLTNSMSFGRPYISKIDGCIHDGWLVISQMTEVFDQDYLYWLLSSYYAYMQFSDKVSGAVVKNLNSEKVANSVFPLPPLAEQRRIAAKIEELLPYIDRYEQAWSKLEDFNKRFPGDMQKSILQMAIEGKLVEQCSEEGTGEELSHKIQEEKRAFIKSWKIKKAMPLTAITEEEKPFDIPENWKWIRFGDVVNIVSARRVHQSDWRKEGVPFYRAREIAKLASEGVVSNELFISNALYDEYSRSGIPKPGDLMVTAVGTLGKTYVVKEGDKFYYKDASVICLENYANLCSEYLKYVMQSEMMMSQVRSNSGGTTVGTLTMIRMNDYIIPLPPVGEQDRIVKKLEELLPLCERLMSYH